jgi:hypothetical protein
LTGRQVARSPGASLIELTTLFLVICLLLWLANRGRRLDER